MLLPEGILDYLPDDSASGVRFFTRDYEKQQEIAKLFTESFEKNWKASEELFEEEVGMEPDERETFPISKPIFYVDYVLFLVDDLCMYANDGARGYNEYGCDAFNKSVSEVIQKFPEIDYDGCIQYAWYDEHTGEMVSYEINNNKKNDEPYNFVGEKLNNSIESGVLLDELDWMGYNSEEKDELLKITEDYQDYITEENIKEYKKAFNVSD